MAEPNKEIRQLHDNASPENVSSWRDLADQLTPEQVAELQDAEHRLRTQAASLPAGYPCDWPPRSESELADILLRAAGRYAGDNLGANLIPDVAPPDGALRVFDWDDARFGVEEATRYFEGSKRFIDRADDPHNDDLTVEIWGTQTPEGQVSRHVNVTEGGYERVTLSSAAHVRQFGEALIAAADEWDQMAGHDRIKIS